MDITNLATEFASLFVNGSGDNISSLLLGITNLAGIVYALVRLFGMKRPAPIWRAIVIVILPFGWVLYLVLDFTMLKADPTKNIEEPQQLAQPPTQQYPTAAEQGPTVTDQSSPAPYSEQQQNIAPQQTILQPTVQAQKPVLTGSAKVFKTIGMVLGIVTMVLGALVIGAIILFVIALSSYGSNK